MFALLAKVSSAEVVVFLNIYQTTFYRILERLLEMITLVLLALVFTAKVSSTDQAAKDGIAVEKADRGLSPAIEGFFAGLKNLLMKFDCDRNDPHCKVWQASKHMLVDDGKAADSVSGAEADNVKKIFDSVGSKSKQAALVKDTENINKAAADYVCFKVPSACQAVR